MVQEIQQHPQIPEAKLFKMSPIMANLIAQIPAQNSNKVGRRHQELQHVRGWSRGNQGERQEAVRPT